MARSKRNSAKGVGEMPLVSTNPTNTGLSETNPVPGSKLPEVVVAIVPEESAPEQKLVIEPETVKPASRRTRSRKQPAAEAVVPPSEPASLLAPPALLLETNEALRLVKERSTEVQDQLRAMTQGMQEAARDAAEVKQGALALKQELQAAGDALGQLHQVRMVREELQDAVREVAEMREKVLVVKQELQATESALAEVRRTAQETQQLREEIHTSSQEVKEVADRSRAVSQELQGTEGALQAIRHTIETLRDDLKGQFREAGSRFLTLGESCQDLHRQLSEIITRVESLRPAVVQVPPTAAIVAVTPPALVGSQVEASAVPGGFEEPGSREPVSPNLTLPEPAREEALGEGKKQLGITVNSQAVVVDVLPETPAEKAGLQRGDVVLDVDGKIISNSSDLRAAIEEAGGNEVQLTVVRGEEKEEVTAHLAEAPVS